MNMNKYFSFAIVVFLMAVPLVLTSCGKDNILDDVEELQPELKVKPLAILAFLIFCNAF